MESARVWCVLYAQVCRVITGYFATVASTQPSPLTTPLTDWARQQHNSTLWDLHTNNMLTGAHRYSAPSLSPSGDELISLKGLKMKISDNGKISMWGVSTLVLKTYTEQMTRVISQLMCVILFFTFLYFASQLIVLLLFWWWHFSVNASLHYPMVRPVTDVSGVLVVTHNRRHFKCCKIIEC